MINNMKTLFYDIFNETKTTKTKKTVIYEKELKTHFCKNLKS